MRPGGPRVPFAFDLRPTPIVLRLIIWNVGIWLAFVLLVFLFEQQWALDLYQDVLALDPAETIFGFEIWQPLTHLFLHDINDGSHIVFNMLALYFLGRPLESRWGGRDFLRFYLLSGVIAGVMVAVVGVLIPGVFGARVVGASGAIMALLVALGMIAPNATVLLFFVLPMRMRTVVWVVLALDTFTFWTSDTDLAWHAHMAGALAGWLLVTGYWRPGKIIRRYHTGKKLRELRARRRKLHVVGDREGGERGPYLH